MKIDNGVLAVRRIRETISREFDNDPARLVAHYIERQRTFTGQVVPGPEDAAPPNEPLPPTGHPAELPPTG
jgi:hypothetical protein